MFEEQQQSVEEPILNSPYQEPLLHWEVREGLAPKKMEGRRDAIYYAPEDTPNNQWDLSDGTLERSEAYAPGLELRLVSRIRELVKKWREAGWQGVSKTTSELLEYWQREDRHFQLFFAQREAVETIVFLQEAKGHVHHGISIPKEELSPSDAAKGLQPFLRYACKMATGTGKTTVMGMIAAWSILNKVADRLNPIFSDTILIVCPNLTIKSRLGELEPSLGEASIYRKYDLVPKSMMSDLQKGTLIVTNWHMLARKELDIGGVKSRVDRRGVVEYRREKITIGAKNDTARGKRYLTLDTLETYEEAGLIERIQNSEVLKGGSLKSVQVVSTKRRESDAAWRKRVLGRAVGKKNILVMNDEAHHAYRIREDDKGPALFDDKSDSDYYKKTATIWVEGLDRLNGAVKTGEKGRINFCLDLSATPTFLSASGVNTHRPFNWLVSDFGLVDAIESGLVKIPEIPVNDSTGAAEPKYFNLWGTIKDNLKAKGKLRKGAQPKPEDVLVEAHPAFSLIAGSWQETFSNWSTSRESDPANTDPRPPVMIIVCKNTKIAKLFYEWVAEGKGIGSLPPSTVSEFSNLVDKTFTIRVDSKVSDEGDGDDSQDDEKRWMRFTLDTVGQREWSLGPDNRPVYPEGFLDLAIKREAKGLLVEREGSIYVPPGRDIRCVISVSMLTEGWSCNTVTHVLGIRPFMSQLLCEQVVGRGLRRVSYELNDEGKFDVEAARIFGVPFRFIPVKGAKTKPVQIPKKNHVFAEKQKAQHCIVYPCVEGYTLPAMRRLEVNWDKIRPMALLADQYPAEVIQKGLSISVEGRPSQFGPGEVSHSKIEEWRKTVRVQAMLFEFSSRLTKRIAARVLDQVPFRAIFGQVLRYVETFLKTKVEVHGGADIRDLFLAPFYGIAMEALESGLDFPTDKAVVPLPVLFENQPSRSTQDIDFKTSRPVKKAVKCHLNYCVFDTKSWEQAAAFYIDTHPKVVSFFKNEGTSLLIPYTHEGRIKNYVPDFVVRLKSQSETPQMLFVETKGYDPLADKKHQAAQKWCDAVNQLGGFGFWRYEVVKTKDGVSTLLDQINT